MNSSSGHSAIVKFDQDELLANFVPAAELSLANALQNIEHYKKHYVIKGIIGSGGFSTVLKADYKAPDGQQIPMALKVLITTTNEARFSREVTCLEKILDGKHMAEFVEFQHVTALPEGPAFILTMRYFDHVPLKQEEMLAMSGEDITRYTYGLLEALAFIHDRNIIHRDIKPSNFLYRPPDKYCLIDFGLAQLIPDDVTACALARQAFSLETREISRSRRHRHTSTSSKKRKVGSTVGVAGYWTNDTRDERKVNRAGTRGYRAPEVLLKCRYHSPAVDIWAAGVILLSILSGRMPFFVSPDDLEALAELTALFGAEPFQQFATAVESYQGKDLIVGPGESQGSFGPEEAPGRNLATLCPTLRQSNLAISADIYDLLQAMLVVDPRDRITAREALRHPSLSQEYENSEETSEAMGGADFNSESDAIGSYHLRFHTY